MEHSVPIFVVDAFTDQLFRGNPAAVCLLPTELPDTVLAAIAREMNLSETAFVRPVTDDGDDGSACTNEFHLRWFTPTVEVPLCGHATLASAYVLYFLAQTAAAAQPVPPCFRVHPARPIRFRTLSGALSVRLTRPEALDAEATGVAPHRSSELEMEFPSNEPAPVVLPPVLLQGLADALQLSADAIAEVQFSALTRKLLVRVATVQQVCAVRPSAAGLCALPFRATAGIDVRGVIVTAAGDPSHRDFARFDCVSRYFAPWVGIDEDPVTGSAHTVLAPYWARITNRTELLALQASARSGVLRLLLPADDGETVLIRGVARAVLAGRLTLPE